MPEFDPLVLSRLQFAANISFHILFPTITIALGWFLLFFKLRFNATGDDKWMQSYFFYTKVFALTFAMGVVSGITMSFQFGTNWPGFMETVGNVAGPLLAYEVLTAFFLEAPFLGIMLFGFRRVPGWLHNLATFLVAIGTTLSAFWILALNSWMQTPAGYEVIDGVVHAKNWFEIIFNPTLPYMLPHKLIASGLTASFLIAGVASMRWILKDRSEAVLSALRTAVTVAAILIPIQIVLGDFYGLNTLEHQPAKVAAIEANWETQNGAPLVLFAVPDEETKTNKYAIEIPKGASFILTHDPDGELVGLDQYEGEHAPVFKVFWSFRVMVGIGLLMLVVAWAAAWNLWRNKEPSPLVTKALVGMTFSGWVATLAGWYVTEIGRQPWLATGILKTEDAVAPVPGAHVGLSLSMYLAVYVVLLTAYIGTIYYLASHAGKAKTKGHPEEGERRATVITEAEEE